MRGKSTVDTHNLALIGDIIYHRLLFSANVESPIIQYTLGSSVCVGCSRLHVSLCWSQTDTWRDQVCELGTEVHVDSRWRSDPHQINMNRPISWAFYKNNKVNDCENTVALQLFWTLKHVHSTACSQDTFYFEMQSILCLFNSYDVCQCNFIVINKKLYSFKLFWWPYCQVDTTKHMSQNRQKSLLQRSYCPKKHLKYWDITFKVWAKVHMAEVLRASILSDARPCSSQTQTPWIEVGNETKCNCPA